MMELNEDTRAIYERILNDSGNQIEIIEARIQEELVRVQEIIGGLWEQEKTVRQIYDTAASVLGVKKRPEAESVERE